MFAFFKVILMFVLASDRFSAGKMNLPILLVITILTDKLILENQVRRFLQKNSSQKLLGI